MKELSSNTNIVVKEADKRGAIAIISTSDYITDCVLFRNEKNSQLFERYNSLYSQS